MSEQSQVTAEDIRVAKPRITDTAFVLACKACKSTAEVAAKTGLTEASVAARANKLRKAGVALPRYDRPKKTVDVNALNDLLK